MEVTEAKPMGKFQRSWILMKYSWGILKSDKRLMLLPLISGLLTFLVLLTFYIPASIITDITKTNATLGWIVTFIYYLIIYFIIIFFNVAFTFIVVNKFNSNEVSIKESMSFAMSKWKHILLYSLISATVGVILEFISRISTTFGNIVASIVGLMFTTIGSVAWSIATFLVIPILVIEGKSPVDAIKESATYLKKTWGEQIIGNLAFGMIIFLFVAPFLVLCFFLVVNGIINLNSVGGISSLVAGFVILAIVLIIGSIIETSLTAIFRVLVYRYAADGTVPEGIDADTLKLAFAPKPKGFRIA